MTLEHSHVKKVIDRWRKILKLESQWNIKFAIRNSSNEMSPGNEDAMACIAVDLRYFGAYIEFNSSELTEQDFDAVVLHELLHILIEPLACSSGCGLGERFEEINSILTESTIERLVPGYMHLYSLVYQQKSYKNHSKSKKSSTRAIRCRRKT